VPEDGKAEVEQTVECRCPERLEKSQEARPGGIGFEGIGGGNGSPSARSVWLMTGLSSAKWLTEWTTGSRIKAAKTKSTRPAAFFFKGVALLGSRMRSGD
jgi:hypothetical protein